MSTLAPLVEPRLTLTAEQAARYARHFTLPGVGAEGQSRLAGARVLSIGAGGLGSPVLLYLAAAGVGTLGVIDDDAVDTSNLQRQIIHADTATGTAKTESAAASIRRLNPGVTVAEHTCQLTADNALDIIAGYDLVVDGSDNFATRYTVNDACEILGTPLVWGTISQYTAQVSVFWARPRYTDTPGSEQPGEPGLGPTLRDLYADMPSPDSVPTCAAGGVLGSLCGTVGSVMATEAIKLITGTPTPLLGTLWMYDARTHHTRTLTITRDPARTPIANLTTVTGEITAHSANLTEETVPEITPADLARTHRDYTLLDVRETHERDTAGYYPGSHHHPHQQLLTALASGATLTEATGIPDTAPLVIYCAGGVRSAKVLRQLIKNNHPGTAYSLAGGYTPLTMK